MKIGVFDSGVGGQSVATAISLALPDDDVVFVNDHENVPYGTKTEAELYKMALPKLQELEDQGCVLVVVACNSLSTTIIDDLQAALSVTLIGVEPLIREAVEVSSSQVIAVCATPRTLSSPRYKKLCAEYAAESVLIEPDCSEWALMIEQNTIDRTKIKMVVDDALEQGADVIVLGCTHYHWIESIIKSIASGRALVLQPEEDVVRRVSRELAKVSSQLS